MKILATCQGCNKRKLIIKQRTYKTPQAGTMQSQSLLCRECYKGIKKMLNAK